MCRRAWDEQRDRSQQQNWVGTQHDLTPYHQQPLDIAREREGTLEAHGAFGPPTPSAPRIAQTGLIGPPFRAKKGRWAAAVRLGLVMRSAARFGKSQKCTA